MENRSEFEARVRPELREPRPDREVQRSVPHEGHQLMDEALHQSHAGIRKLASEGGHHFGHDDFRGDRAEAKRDRAGSASGEGAKLVFCPRELALRGSGARVEAPAVAREASAVRSPVDERDLQFGLQRAQTFAEGRLGKTEPARRGAEAAALRYGDEVRQLSDPNGITSSYGERYCRKFPGRPQGAVLPAGVEEEP